MHGVEIGNSAPREACLAGACPKPEELTFPRMTSSTFSFGMPALSKAARMVMDESSVALNLESLPMKLPMGVLLPATM